MDNEKRKALIAYGLGLFFWVVFLLDRVLKRPVPAWVVFAAFAAGVAYLVWEIRRWQRGRKRRRRGGKGGGR